MPWTNYHSHTHYCDGKNHPQEYIKSAIEQGLAAYGYSSHAPIGFNTDWCVKEAELDNYVKDVEQIKQDYSDRIEIYLGLEVDYIPGVASWQKAAYRDRHNFDFFIGSIHFVDSLPDGTHWNIDHTKEKFDFGLDKIFNGDFRLASERFYALTRQMIVEDKPDVVGHLDKIKMYNKHGEYFQGDEAWYKEQVMGTLEVVKNAGTIVEVNTRGFYRYGQDELYPSQWIIKEMANMDIPIMLNSDAHECHELIEGFEYAARELSTLGVRKLWSFIGGVWSGYDFDETGLHL